MGAIGLMSRQAVDMTGQIFGRLTCIKPGRLANRSKHWICKCVCGTFTEVCRQNLLKGTISSCGCLKLEIQSTTGNYFKHGMARGENTTSEYSPWQSMKTRCYNNNAINYKDYSGRGIKVCDEWLNDFVAFYSYIGPKPSENHSVDRIENNGNYEPGNVKWSTATEQNNNRRFCKS